jgi:hypothetical protein
MADSTGYILTAAAIVAGNEALLAPAVNKTPMFKDFNWRIIPAAGIAALTLAGLENLAPPLGKGLAVLALLSVFIVPVAGKTSPVDNAIKLLGLKG